MVPSVLCLQGMGLVQSSDCGLLKSSLPAFSPRLVALGVGVVKTLRYPERKQTDLGARLWFLLVVWRGVGGAVLCPWGPQ